MTTRDLLAAYDQKFRATFGAPAPIVAGKDGAVAKMLLTRYDPAQLDAWLDAFFESDDAFIQNSSYSFGVFAAVIGKLIVAARRAEQPRVSRTEAMLLKYGKRA